MNPPLSDLALLLRSMEPALHPGVFVFTSLRDAAEVEASTIIASIREPEGLSVVMREEDAQERGLPILFRAAWITLTVTSDLAAVGLTAAFASALGADGISCNVVAGAYHDHIFVSVESAERAMLALRRLQASAAGNG
jgi:uncharacterized protein